MDAGTGEGELNAIDAGSGRRPSCRSQFCAMHKP
jgi:hypothetical protein